MRPAVLWAAAEALQSTATSDAERERAAATIADVLPIGIARPSGYREWKREAKNLTGYDASSPEGISALRGFLKSAILTAAERADQVTIIRLGGRWLVDINGRKRRVRPRDLFIEKGSA
jgi:hypothetical protein